jgi:hypothetical protein
MSEIPLKFFKSIHQKTFTLKEILLHHPENPSLTLSGSQPARKRIEKNKIV